jgi:hypothetical protein
LRVGDQRVETRSGVGDLSDLRQILRRPNLGYGCLTDVASLRKKISAPFKVGDVPDAFNALTKMGRVENVLCLDQPGDLVGVQSRVVGG